jgi:hypothetical protein
LGFDSWPDFAEAASQQLGIKFEPELGNEGKFYWVLYVMGAVILCGALVWVMLKYGSKKM